MTDEKHDIIHTLPNWEKYAKSRKLLEKVFEVDLKKKGKKTTRISKGGYKRPKPNHSRSNTMSQSKTKPFKVVDASGKTIVTFDEESRNPNSYVGSMFSGYLERNSLSREEVVELLIQNFVRKGFPPSWVRKVK